jgi:hypothetical protein
MTCTPLLAQDEDYEHNLIGIDFHVFGTSFHYAGRIGNGLYLGVENEFVIIASPLIRINFR